VCIGSESAYKFFSDLRDGFAKLTEASASNQLRLNLM
jgi:hypothetical protein